MEKYNKVSFAAATIGSMTLLSRIFGFFRDFSIAMVFGSSAAADAFFVAFRIPNVQRRLFGEGAVTSAFIPIFTDDVKNKNSDKAWEFTSHLFTILFYTLVTLSLFIMLLAPYLISILAPGFIDQTVKFNLTVSLTRWMAPFLIFIA